MLESKLAAQLIGRAKDKWGEQAWVKLSQEQLRLQYALSKSPLGDLIKAAERFNDVAGEVIVPEEFISSFKALLFYRNRAAHQDLSGDDMTKICESPVPIFTGVFKYIFG